MRFVISPRRRKWQQEAKPASVPPIKKEETPVLSQNDSAEGASSGFCAYKCMNHVICMPVEDVWSNTTGLFHKNDEEEKVANDDEEDSAAEEQLGEFRAGIAHVTRKISHKSKEMWDDVSCATAKTVPHLMGGLLLDLALYQPSEGTLRTLEKRRLVALEGASRAESLALTPATVAPKQSSGAVVKRLFRCCSRRHKTAHHKGAKKVRFSSHANHKHMHAWENHK